MKDIINIILGGLLTLSGVLLAYYLNNKKENRRLIERLKSETIAICTRLNTAYSQAILYDIQCKAMYRIYDLNKKIEYKTLGDSFLERTLDATMDMNHLKTDLLQNLIELYNYLNKDDIDYLKTKFSVIKKLSFKEQNFEDINSENELREKRLDLIKGLLKLLKTTDMYLISEDIKKRLSPHL
jgi:hypothetical protein